MAVQSCGICVELLYKDLKLLHFFTVEPVIYDHWISQPPFDKVAMYENDDERCT